MKECVYFFSQAIFISYTTLHLKQAHVTASLCFDLLTL